MALSKRFCVQYIHRQLICLAYGVPTYHFTYLPRELKCAVCKSGRGGGHTTSKLFYEVSDCKVSRLQR